jgi:hypothetical protein
MKFKSVSSGDRSVASRSCWREASAQAVWTTTRDTAKAVMLVELRRTAIKPLGQALRDRGQAIRVGRMPMEWSTR